MAEEQQFWALRFGELGLKSAPVRRNFERVLRNSLERGAIANGIDLFLERSDNLMLASSHGEKSIIEGLLRRCFGLVGADPVTAMELDPLVVAMAALERDAMRNEPRTFAVRCKRSGAKQEWGSQDFAGEVGYHMLQNDSGLKVDLSNPQNTIRVHMSASRAWLMDDRVAGPGGLPAGVQGDVIARISTQDEMLSAWQVMRRGAGIVAIEGSDDAFLEMLDQWDPGLLQAAKGFPSASRRKRTAKRTPWGFIGITREEAKKLIREDRHRDTPAAELNATQGWSDNEKKALLSHIQNPDDQTWGHAGNEALLSWIT
ncbi:MAG: THUMP domain-containing protein [Candidatus Poseidoniaceae archaeon]|jgi:thiamine biosynthesis protein ThiI|nr:THUMP domain-containing protein [Candidatus Poseidoniaceae archaeon]MDP7202879.1 THUMP domain-containing protein [Candidatus Poseidoniaceae archaeon]